MKFAFCPHAQVEHLAQKSLIDLPEYQSFRDAGITRVVEDVYLLTYKP